MKTSQMGQRLAVCAAVMASVLVALGAFGAHALSDLIGPVSMETYRTGVGYAQWHLLAMFAAGIIHSRSGVPAALQAAWGFLMGVILFSGSLMLLAVTGWTILGALAPVGGLFFIVSWLFLARAVWIWTESD